MTEERKKSGREATAEKRIRTLIVEDSAPVRRAIASFLEGQNHVMVVGTAIDGRDAIEQVEALRPDLVLTDWQMPEVNGLQLTSHLRGLYPDIKVILITVHDSPELRAESARHGAHSFIPTDRLHVELSSEIARIFPPQDQ